MPWFYKSLAHSTTNTIEMRVCCDQDTNDEDVTFEQYEFNCYGFYSEDENICKSSFRYMTPMGSVLLSLDCIHDMVFVLVINQSLLVVNALV